jgi:hypothetical protein
MIRLSRSLPFAVAVIFLTVTPEPAYACSCRLPSVKEAVTLSDAVVEGRVIDIDRGYLRLTWCEVKRFFGSLPADVEDSCGIQVTLEVNKRWKGEAQNAVQIATGRGGGDCGVPFELWRSYLVYLRNVLDPLSSQPRIACPHYQVLKPPRTAKS